MFDSTSVLLLFIGSVSLSKRVRYLTLGTWEFPFLADTECERGAFGNVRMDWMTLTIGGSVRGAPLACRGIATGHLSRFIMCPRPAGKKRLIIVLKGCWWNPLILRTIPPPHARIKSERNTHLKSLGSFLGLIIPFRLYASVMTANRCNKHSHETRKSAKKSNNQLGNIRQKREQKTLRWKPGLLCEAVSLPVHLMHLTGKVEWPVKNWVPCSGKNWQN